MKTKVIEKKKTKNIMNIMNIFKRLTVLLSVFCLLTGCITGCQQSTADNQQSANPLIRVGSLKGPTSIGLVSLMEESESGLAAGNYEFTMETAADVLMASMVSGNLDIALVPANMASIMYKKTSGEIRVIDINTLGVLYGVSGDDSISQMSDLAGKTIYLTGKGTTPDFVFQYLLSSYGMSADDVNIEYKSEATEILAVLKEDKDAVGILPQPFATVAVIQDDSLKTVLDTTRLWDELQGENGSRLVTGVTVVRKEFLEQNREAVLQFMSEHEKSVQNVNGDPSAASELVVKFGIIEKAPVAAKAIPLCNISYIDNEEMKNALSGYLSVLYELDATSVGGELPDDAFYFEH